MVSPLIRTASPLRLFLLLSVLLLLGALLVEFGVNQPPIHTTGSHAQPAPMLVTTSATTPNTVTQPAANAAAAGTTRVVTGSTQGPSVAAPPAAAEQAAPAGPAACQPNPPAGRGTPVICSNP